MYCTVMQCKYVGSDDSGLETPLVTYDLVHQLLCMHVM